MTKILKLYLVVRPKEDVNYDENAGFLVAAYTPAEARRIAARNAKDTGWWPGDEGASPWYDVTSSTCTQIGVAREAVVKEPGILMRDFRAG